MARPRSNTATLTKEGHSISLKVLRLSRPSLAQQIALPRAQPTGIPRTASLAYPSSSTDADFVLTPILSLPPSFGSAYVGETFSCAIVANNEFDPANAQTKAISGLRLVAEMQTPSQNFPLELYASIEADDADVLEQSDREIKPGRSLQRIVDFPLREEGNHTLIIGVFYNEITTTQQPTTNISGPASEDLSQQPATRARTFRKMYQFPTTPCLSVRTKATELSPREIPDKSLGDPYGRMTLIRYALEAQLENVGETRITLVKALFLARPPFEAQAFNNGLCSSPKENDMDSDDNDDDDDDIGKDKNDEEKNPAKRLHNTNTDTEVSEAESGSGSGSESEPEENSSSPPSPPPKDEATNTTRLHEQRQKSTNIVLQPRSIHQLLFHIEQQAHATTGLDEMKAGLKTDGRVVLGQISLEWRSSMGERGALSTGNLMSRRRP